MNAPQMHTLAELQAILSGQIDLLVAGETTPANANAIVNSVAAFLRPLKMQMDYAKQTGKTPSIPLLSTGSES
jgi:hypothetical protein